MASVQTRADRDLARLDRRVGKAATYFVVGNPSVDVETGEATLNTTEVPDVIVRSKGISVDDLRSLAQAGISQVEAAWSMRHAYLDNAKSSDQLLLTVAGFRYEILHATLDRVQADWTLFTRRMRV